MLRRACSSANAQPGRPRWFNACASPPASPQGYGLTETTAASFIMLPNPKMSYTGVCVCVCVHEVMCVV